MRARVYWTEGLAGELDPPSSKNYTTRYLLAAALAEGESRVCRPAASDDADAMVRCLRAFGARIDEETDVQGVPALRVRGFGRRPADPGVVDPGNAGAVLRLLLGIGALLPEVRFETGHADSLGQRPHADLLAALEQLGAHAESNQGRLPIRLRGGSLRGGKVEVSGARSSQYLSSLLFLAPLIDREVEIQVTEGLVSRPLVRTTLEVLGQAGIEVTAAADLMHFHVAAGQAYRPREYTVNGDWPSAAAILAAGAVAGSRVRVGRLFADAQGERAAVALLCQMGADVAFDGSAAEVRGPARLRAAAFDGDTATDMILAMLAVAAVAEGESRFYGIGNLRLKECDRIAMPVRELGRLGVDCREGPAEIRVRGRPDGYEGGIEVDTWHDHRMAQLLALVGLRCRGGLVVRDAQNVGKSYPGFFADLARLGARVELEP